MKSKLITVTAILLILAGGMGSCEKQPPPEPPLCAIERPKGIKPIDWKNYNGVHTVYWTYDRRDTREKEMKVLLRDAGKFIKVYGWIGRIWHHSINDGMTEFELLGNEIDDDSDFARARVRFEVVGCMEVKISLYEKLVSADPTKKIYVRGNLSFSGVHIDFVGGSCDIVFPQVRVYSVEDVYFE